MFSIALSHFFGCPSCLRTVKTNIWTRDHRKLRLPWSQLTELTIHSSGVFADVFLAMLVRCTSLKRCYIVYIHEISDATASRVAVRSKTPVRLPRLTHLHLWLPNSPRIYQFLSSLVFPNLRELTLRGGFGGWPDYLGPSASASAPDCILFLRHFSSTLQVLNLQEGVGSSGLVNFERMLEVTPNVKGVSLRYGFPVRLSTMKMIAEGVLLPNVEDINIDVGDAAAVIDMVKTRQSNAHISLTASPGVQSLSYLKKVTVNWVNDRHRLTRFDQGSIEDMRSLGLEIVINQ